MRIQIMLVLVALVVPTATEASAQDVNLSGPYQCVVNCAGPWARYGHAERLGPQSRERNWHAFSRLG
jgi:hypothetical protein